MPVVTDPTARVVGDAAATVPTTVDLTSASVDANETPNASTAKLASTNPTDHSGDKNTNVDSAAKSVVGSSALVSPERDLLRKACAPSKQWPGDSSSVDSGSAGADSSLITKKSKLPFLDSLDFKSQDNVMSSYRAVKGESAPRLQSLPEYFVAIFNAYNVQALKSYTAANEIEYKGNKGPAIEHIAQHLTKRVQQPRDLPRDESTVNTNTAATLTLVVEPPTAENFEAFASHQLSTDINITKEYAMVCLRVAHGRATETDTNSVLLVMKSSTHVTLTPDLESMNVCLGIKENDEVHLAWERFDSMDAAKAFLLAAKEQHETPKQTQPVLFGFDKQLSRNPTDLNNFTEHSLKQHVGVIPPSHERYLVLLLHNGKVELYHSARDAQMVISKLADMQAKSGIYYGWKIFLDLAEAEEFFAKLSSVRDLASHIPRDFESSQQRGRNALSQLIHEKGFLNDFMSGAFELATSNDKKQTKWSHLVVMGMDYTATTLQASDSDVVSRVMHIVQNPSKYFGWKCFTCVGDAEDLETELKMVDKLSPLPTSLAATDPTSPVYPSAAFTTPTKRPADIAFDGTSSRTRTASGSAQISAGNPSDMSSFSGPHNPYKPSGKPGMYSFNAKSPIILANGGNKAFDMSAAGLNFDKKGREKGMGAQFFVSREIPNKDNTMLYAFVYMMVPSSLYYAQGEFFKMLLENFIDSVMKPRGEAPPMWMTTIDDIPRCLYSNPSEYLRSKSGYVRTTIGWILEMPRGLSNLDSFAVNSINSLASIFKAGSGIGSHFVDWMRTAKGSVYDFETGVNGKKKKIKHEEFVKLVENRLVKMFENKNIEYNTPLDKFMTHGHIKEFLINHCGYNDWSELDRDLKSAILTKWHNSYPDWESTEVKPYRDN